MDEFGIRAICPPTRGLIELARKHAHGYRKGYILEIEERKPVLPIETRRGIPVFVSQ
jgi:hypothetical protein